MKNLLAFCISLLPLFSFSQQQVELFKAEGEGSVQLFVPKSYSPNFSNPLILDLSFGQDAKSTSPALSDSCMVLFGQGLRTSASWDSAWSKLTNRFLVDFKRIYLRSSAADLPVFLQFLKDHPGLVKGAWMNVESSNPDRDDEAFLELFDHPFWYGSSNASALQNWTDVLRFHEVIAQQGALTANWEQTAFFWVDSLARMDVSEVLMSDRDVAERYEVIVFPLKVQNGLVNISYSGLSDSKAQIQLLDRKGGVVLSDSVQFFEGKTTYQFPTLKQSDYFSLQLWMDEVLYEKRIYIER